MDYDESLKKCPFCQSESIGQYDADYVGNCIFRCRDCSGMFMNPQYSDAYLHDFYSHYVALDDSGKDDARQAAVRCLTHNHYLSMIEKRVEKGKLLSVGCGDGFEMGIARERGWQVEGYDVDPSTTAAVSELLGVRVQCGDFRGVAYSPGEFDCVYMHQVIEHPKNPQEYLRKIHQILRPGGIMFVAVPNIGSISSRLKTVAGKLRLKKRRGRHYDTFHHIFYYSPASLKHILERHYGFRVVHTENGLGHKARARRFSERRIRREIWCNRFLPCWKDVFVLLAATPVPADAATYSTAERS